MPQINLIEQIDEYLFHEGKHIFAYMFMGAHVIEQNGISGVKFTTWAPNANNVWLVGDFSYWQVDDRYRLKLINYGGLWSIFIPHLGHGTKYKFAVQNKYTLGTRYKADPYAFYSELRPATSSIVYQHIDFKWEDQYWLEQRATTNLDARPMNIYELHLASWRTNNGKFLSYAEIAELLPKYIQEMGYTHVEIMPLSEHPLDASWGYQPTGYYSVTSRHGEPDGLKILINKLHKNNIGVILDWVPGHFCKDEHGLINFDGQACYEYQSNKKANNKDWGTHNFDLGRNEVKTFLISNAIYWFKEFHFDGIRVDAVSNILYLNYAKNDGEWEANIYGGKENIEGINFLRELNAVIKHNCQGAITIAEESSAWPNITLDVAHGGLGFNYKWNMGWMNDTLRYVIKDAVYRKHHHNQINFSMVYNYSEKFILAISHDEVVHGKKSLINKMWGDLWSKFAGLKLYLTYMHGHPGKKLIFMGCEFGQFVEWREYEQLQWQIIDKFHTHAEILRFSKALNQFYLLHKPLWELDFATAGFEWIDANNSHQSILSFIRYAQNKQDCLIYVCNFTPLVYHNYNIGVPYSGTYIEVFNTDELNYGGSGQLNQEHKVSFMHQFKHFNYSIAITVPPLAVTVFKYVN
ncbi:MAG: 1,4-alpha-glucan branching protein GlgB [Burkholderiales bacterium]|jgi:1,4-alpha-glucan branching enzyme|nr:1,4-alpha-glucan branching protein GlgB [Burkholderiales bacterium]